MIGALRVAFHESGGGGGRKERRKKVAHPLRISPPPPPAPPPPPCPSPVLCEKDAAYVAEDGIGGRQFTRRVGYLPLWYRL